MITADDITNVLSSFEVTGIPKVVVSPGAATTISTNSWSLWAVDEIKSSFSLSDDWDGQGSPPPTPRASKVAAAFVQRVAEEVTTSPMSIGATTDGGFEIEWGPSLMSAVVEVAGDGSVTGWYNDPERGLLDLI